MPLISVCNQGLLLQEKAKELCLHVFLDCMVKIVNMVIVVYLPMIVKLTRYSPEPHNACTHCCLAESYLCLLQSLLQEKALLARVCGKDCQHGDGSTISDLMRSPQRSRVRCSKLIAWRRTKLLYRSVYSGKKRILIILFSLHLHYIMYFFFFL